MLPAPANNQVNLFLCNKLSAVDEDNHDFYMDVLSSTELKKFQSFYFEKDRNMYLLAHAMLRLVLSNQLNCSTQSLLFIENTYGKPALANHPEISFNLSHSKHAVALAITDINQVDLGLDIESTHDRGLVVDLAERFFSEEEYELLTNQPTEQQNQTFFKLWTLKEAYIKAIGKGLSIDLAKFSFRSLDQGIQISHYSKVEASHAWHFYNTQIFQTFQLSLAVRHLKKVNTPPVIKTFEYIPNVSCNEIPVSFITT